MSQLFLDQLNSEGRLVLTVRVHPHAKKTGMRGIMADGSVKIDVRAAAEGGKANGEVCRFLSETFGVPLGNVEILSGHRGRKKLLAVTRVIS